MVRASPTHKSRPSLVHYWKAVYSSAIARFKTVYLHVMHFCVCVCLCVHMLVLYVFLQKKFVVQYYTAPLTYAHGRMYCRKTYLPVSLINGRTIWIDDSDSSLSRVSVTTGLITGILSILEFLSNMYLKILSKLQLSLNCN